MRCTFSPFMTQYVYTWNVRAQPPCPGSDDGERFQGLGRRSLRDEAPRELALREPPPRAAGQPEISASPAQEIRGPLIPSNRGWHGDCAGFRAGCRSLPASIVV